MIPDVTRDGFWENLGVLNPLGFLQAGQAQDTITKVRGDYRQKAQDKVDFLIAQGASPDDPLIRQYQDKLDLEKKGSELAPLKTDTEMDSFIEGSDKKGFRAEGGDSNNAKIGTLSERFESGGNAGAIGYDTTGGWSYGAYQLAHNNAKKFIDQSPYAEQFAGIAFNSKGYRDKWQQVAKADPEGFKSAQKEYIGSTHYQPQADKLASIGFDPSTRSTALQDVIWSTAVQHGAGTDVVTNALAKVGKDASDADIIKAIYNERWSGGRRFASSTKAVRNSVYRRFFAKDGELNRALTMLG
jgi:hypothetical protein